MKIKRLLIGMLACSAMVACTNDDLLENNEQGNQIKGDKAYVMVSIKNANGISSRGTGVDENENPIFSDGVDENEVGSATFFF